MNLQVDNEFRVFADGDANLIDKGTDWPTTYTLNFKPGIQVVGIEGKNFVSQFI